MSTFSILGQTAEPKRLVRVFPRRTKASPDDEMAFFGPPDLFVEADEVHVDVTFTADKEKAESLAEDWRHVAHVKIGGVAYEDPGQEFIPGRYTKVIRLLLSKSPLCNAPSMNPFWTHDAEKVTCSACRRKLSRLK